MRAGGHGASFLSVPQAGEVVVQKFRDVAVAVLVSTALVLPALVLAFSSGANSGLTNGPANNASNCTVCHVFEVGIGGVEVLGAPRRYLPGRTYDLSVRVFDVDQVGAGFEVSAETGAGHVGTFVVSDPTNTQFADGDPNYITHTLVGHETSHDVWAANGGSYTFNVQWVAPSADFGDVTIFGVGNASNLPTGPEGEHFYANYAIAQFAVTGDADGDTDVDLRDFATLQQCFGAAVGLPSACAFVDDDADALVAISDYGAMFGVLLGPTAIDPPAFVLADAVRGAKLYDKWWAEARVPTPTTDHPLWASRPDTVSNTRTGSATWRCKECHGWDYKGVDGVYGGGSHRTGIAGVFGTTKTPTEIFNLLRDPADHAYTAALTGLTDEDVWDAVKFVLTGQVDTDSHIDSGGVFYGSSPLGSVWYGRACFNCHGEDGTQVNFGTPADPEYVGTVAVANPWEFLHKARYGHPGSGMLGTEILQWDIIRASDIGAYTQSMPVQ